MAVNSKRKGARGEREFAALCRDEGYPVRRGQQYSGLGAADCVGLPGVHIEVKRVNRLNLYDALAQAKRDAPPGKLPIVAHRRDHCDWVVIMDARSWFELYREWEASRALTSYGLGEEDQDAKAD